MPNWTSNTLKAPAEVLKKYIRKDKDGMDVFDFNLVIPRPEIYNDPELTEGFDTEWCIYWYKSKKGTDDSVNPLDYESNVAKMLKYCLERSDEYYRRGKKYTEAFDEYGHRTWFGWDNEFWGTKWNSCEPDCSHVDEGWVTFNTAWCMPEPIIKKIMLDNHDCEISITWRDEDYDGTRTFWHDGHGGYHNKTEWEDEYAYHDEDEDAER